MREIRVHGQDRRNHHPIIGVNGRMDTLQAAIVLAKLVIFPEEVELRRQAGERYTELLNAGELSDIAAPHVAAGNTSVYAQYTIRAGDLEAVQARLKEAGIPSAIHYPVPLYRQPAFAGFGYGAEACPPAEQASHQVISLPIVNGH